MTSFAMEYWEQAVVVNGQDSRKVVLFLTQIS